jgi:hypothetical protein
MAATSSAAFNEKTKFVTLYTDADCYISFRNTATTTIGSQDSFLLPAGIFKDYAVRPGGTLSAITAAGTATLQVEEFFGADWHGNQNVPMPGTVQKVDVTT